MSTDSTPLTPKAIPIVKPYYILLVRDGKNSDWRVEFGSHNKDEVFYERDYYLDNGIKKSNMQIEKLKDQSQKRINLHVGHLNKQRIKFADGTQSLNSNCKMENVKTKFTFGDKD